MQDIAHTHYIHFSVRCEGCCIKCEARFFFLSVSDSFEPLAPEPQVANELAKGAKDKTQTQGDEEYGEREDENRRDTAPFISLDRGPCCTT